MNEPEVFLDLDRIPSLATCSFRRFDPGEYHVTRVSDCDVLLLMLEGKLIFYEDGKRISLLPGQWYIQRAVSNRWSSGRKSPGSNLPARGSGCRGSGEKSP